MLVELDNEIWFPDPRNGDSDGCFAFGGDLSTDRLILAYSHGIFPWFAFRNSPILWFCPMERFVIFPDKIHISHSMRTILNRDEFTFSINTDFEGVIHNCSTCNNRIDEEGAWLGERMIKQYTLLHKLGYASSVEVYREEQLVGGLYGITMGRCFIGESMFSLVPNGSKLALIFLAHWLQSIGNCIIDCQIETPHLRSMGGTYISYDEYLTYLE